MLCSSKTNFSIRWLLLVGLLAGGLSAQGQAPRPAFYASLGAAYEVASTNQQSLVLLVFSADWCGPCKLLKKNTLDSEVFLGRAGALEIVDVDVDADSKTARLFNVSAVPNLVLLSADKKIIARQSGYIEPEALLKWIEDGRQRAARGQWDGAAPGAKIEALVAKAARNELEGSDLKELIAMLGQPDPAERLGASKLILAQRDNAVTPLIDALSDPYLGVRIEAGALLHKLAPDSPAVDPWQSPADLADTVAALKTWWKETGKLPPIDPARTVDPSVKSSIASAVQALRSDDPVKRTDAMTALVARGEDSLPALREAIKRAERNGDHRYLTLMEDVRWAILIPDVLEQRSPVRHALARGSSPQRQAATAQLGKFGGDAIIPLLELTSDADSLVVEGAVRALSSVGGKKAIPAMAALLKAADANVRMTAAQALGHSKNRDANTFLASAVDDPNEIVACAAIASLEEINGRENSGLKKSPEVISALKTSLVDTRWRVRAAGAEVIGKIRISQLTSDLKALLKDPDGFVVKSVLEALNSLGSRPNTAELKAIGRRLPSLLADTVQMMIESDSDETVKAVTEIYDASDLDEKLAVLRALARRERSDSENKKSTWKPLLRNATSAVDVRLRRQAAEILATASPEMAAELIGQLLGDEDLETRTAAAQASLNILARKPDESDKKKSGKTNAMVSAEKIAGWHAALAKHPIADTNVILAAAFYVTGDSKSNLLTLAAALRCADEKSIDQMQAASAFRAIMLKLPYPEAKGIVEGFCTKPTVFCQVVSDSDRAAPALVDYLMEPARFKAAVEPASGDALRNCLQVLLSERTGSKNWKWSLLSQNEQEIQSALFNSTNAGWRAAALYAMSQRKDEQTKAAIQKGLADSNAWVRVTAVKAFARSKPGRGPLEEQLGRLLSDSDQHVATVAAQALLEPETMESAGPGWQWGFQRFQYEDVQAGTGSFTSSSEERPLVVLETKPAFLEPVLARLTNAEPQLKQTLTLLLAQYGKFEALEEMVKTRDPKSGEDDSVALTGIGLSRDPKYIPYLRARMQSLQDEWNLRKILRACKNMTGAEARQLRLDINKQIRKAGESNND